MQIVRKTLVFAVFSLFVSVCSFADESLFAPNSVVSNACSFVNLNTYSGTVTMTPVYEDTKHNCEPGYYLPANGTECVVCLADHYCDGGEYVMSDSDNGISECPNGLVSGTGAQSAAFCGKIMQVGDNVLYLTSEQQTHPALAVRVDGNTYYAKTTPVSAGVKAINAVATDSLRTKVDGTEYSIHDYTIQGE